MSKREPGVGCSAILLSCLGVLAVVGNLFAGEMEKDVVIYGSSPAALTAAISVQKLGKSAVIVCPETRIGGLTTGGLGQTDIGNKQAFGGLALRFYRDVADHYRMPSSWKWQMRTDYLPDGQCTGTKGEDSMWTFEPSAALAVLEKWERMYRLDIRRGECLDRNSGGVMKEGLRIQGFRTLSGNVYRGRVFVDATYEGDLMAAAGVSYCVGREANATYGETLNGTQVANAKYHNFVDGVDPYVEKGVPASGLLPGIERGSIEADGTGDRRVQAYCFRMCLTDVPGNRIPFAKPADYDERDYELLLRNFEAGERAIPWINSRMPNHKTDTNNRLGFSTDFIGQNWNWPEASYAERKEILAAHLRYQQGLMWTLANHSRVPELVRREVSRWGTCRDEFEDGLGDGWQNQLYVREARRLVGDYVMTEAHCRNRRKAERPVAMAAYQMDSHNVRRYVTAKGLVKNEGDVEVGGGNGPFGIDYGAIIPKRGECANLFVPVCLSASHIAFGSIRMEPVFFALGQAAGTAAAQTVDTGCAVQDLAYAPLRDQLQADGQVVFVDPPRHVQVAAANSSAADRRSADFVCKGAYDEEVISAAISVLSKGGTVQLLDGDYYIDSFEKEGTSAILFGYNDGLARTITISGTTENKGYNTALGVTLHVTKRAMESIDPAKGIFRVFYGAERRPDMAPDWFTYTHVNNVNFRNFFLKFHDASRPLIGIDCRNFGSFEMELVGVYTENYFPDRFLHRKPATPAKGTIGIWTVPGSNDEMARIAMTYVNVGGLHTGVYFDAVDHLVLRSCTTARCCYGYVFRGGPKTLTMLNCCDEGNTHLPKFIGSGHLTAVDFNVERFNADYIPDDPEGDADPYAYEEMPGGWRGFLSYTLQGSAFALKGFWRDGGGKGFRTDRLDGKDRNCSLSR